MRKLVLAFITVIFTLGSTIAQVIEPVEWNISVQGNIVVMTATIDQPWYMYDMTRHKEGPNPTTFNFTLPEGVSLKGEIREITPSVKKFDDSFKIDIGTYSKRAVFHQEFINRTKEVAKITGIVEWQACDGSSCLPPTDYEFQFKIEPTAKAQPDSGQAATAPQEAEGAIGATSLIAASSNDSTGNGTGSTLEEDPNHVDQIVSADETAPPTRKNSLWQILLTAAGGALLAILTPCVFPMVPMTVSFFIQGAGSNAEGNRKRRGRFLAMIYGLSIIALYTLPIAIIILITYFLGGDAVTANIFNWLATHWIPNLIFFSLFVIFAISFFGAFEITMPSKLVNRSDSKADKGGLIGVFFMALTLVLVSFSCTGPIMGSVLVQSTQGGVLEPIITMLVFSTVFALPFTLLAFFPSLLKNLPKSGGWLNTVKVVLGFVMMAFALKFFSIADQTYHWGLLDREIFIAIWIVLFSFLGLYLLGKLQMRHDSPTQFISVKRLVMAIATFTFVVYLIPGMWGAPLRGLGSFLPSMSTHDFNIASMRSSGATSGNGGSILDLSKVQGGKPLHSDFLHMPAGMEGFFDYQQALDYARQVNKPMLLDFTGHGCANCHNMEANVISDPAVVALLQSKYVTTVLYVDDKKELPEEHWVVDGRGRTLKTLGRINSEFQISRFSINSQPYFVLINPHSEEILVEARSFDLNVADFVSWLNRGIEVFNRQ